MYQYKIDLTSMPPIQEERYKVVESFEALYWDVRMHMEVIDHLTSQKITTILEVTWEPNTKPVFPPLPKECKIHQV